MLCSFFFPIKTKFIPVAACQNLLTPPHFSKWQLSAEVEEGARLRYCVYAQEQSLFSMSHFFWQPVHIHSIESTADWIHFAFCNLVFIFLFFVVFAFSTIMNVCCQFHDETLFITKLHFLKAKIAVDLKRFLYLK